MVGEQSSKTGLSRREFLKIFGAGVGVTAAGLLEKVSLQVARADIVQSPEKQDAATARYYVEQLPDLQSDFNRLSELVYGGEALPKDELVLLRVPQPRQALILRFPHVVLPEGTTPTGKKGKGSLDNSLRIRIQRAEDTDPVVFGDQEVPDDYLVYSLEHDLDYMLPVMSNLEVDSPDQAFAAGILMPNSESPFMATFGVSDDQLYLYFPSQRVTETDPSNPALAMIYTDLELGEAELYRPRFDE